jgi:hypothetical protein
MYEQLLGIADWLFTLILLAILCTPIVGFLRGGRKVRREEVLRPFNPELIKLYFRMFSPEKWAAIAEDGQLSDKQLVLAFCRNYDERFGLWRYLVSSLLLMATTAATLYLALVAAAAWLQNDNATHTLPSIGVVAVAGAYLSVVTEIIARHRAGDLWPRDLLLAALRMALAVPVGYAFSAMAAEPIGLPIAFMMGAFPIKTLITMSRRLAARKLSLGEEARIPEDAGSGSSELEKLQGVRGAIVERLDDENITTILQLAYTDPLELTIRTGYSFTYILDCVSQALAWIYLEGHLQDLRVLGMRGACEVRNLIEGLDKGKAKMRERRKAQVEAIAKKLEVDVESCELMLREIAEDPHTTFIADIWQPGTEEKETNEE